MREARPLGASPGAFPTDASEIACFEAGVGGAAARRSLQVSCPALLPTPVKDVAAQS